MYFSRKRMEKNLEDNLKIEANDLDSYSLACLGSLYVLDEKNPDQMVCLLRGGYPPFRVVSALARDYLGRDPQSFLVPTSDFLKNKKHLISALAEDALRLANRNEGHASLYTIDTAITGSSSRQFAREFISGFKRIARTDALLDDMNIDYHFLRFWDDSEGRYSKTKLRPEKRKAKVKGENGQSTLTMHDYNFGVRSLICEDKPILLGVDYPIHIREEDNEGVRGQKSEYVSPVDMHLPIVLMHPEGDRRYQPHGEQTTADLFVDLAVERARKNIDKLSQLDSRENLDTLEYPPYLVDFCKKVARK